MGRGFPPRLFGLEVIRGLLPDCVPVLFASATYGPEMFEEICKSLNISDDRLHRTNLGNDRHKVKPEIRIMEGKKKDFQSLTYLKEEFDRLGYLEHCMLFGQTDAECQDMVRHLHKMFPEHKDEIEIYIEKNGKLAKKKDMQNVRKGRVKILVCTEAAGTRCDIPDVVEAVQYGCPESLCVWTQRGRAGRRPTIKARAILSVEPTMFSVKPKPDSSETVKGKKEIKD